MKVIKNKKIRSLLRFLIPFVILPLCAFLCAAVIDPDWHLAISVLTALFSVLLFISGYRRETSRRSFGYDRVIGRWKIYSPV